eukprot:403333947
MPPSTSINQDYEEIDEEDEKSQNASPFTNKNVKHTKLREQEDVQSNLDRDDDGVETQESNSPRISDKNQRYEKDSDSKQCVTVDQAFELCGGFGRFQYFNALLTIMTMGSSSFFLSSLAFLELEPHYICLKKDSVNVWEECSASKFCEDQTIQWRIDWENQESLDNFVQKFGLYCNADVQIGLFGSIFLLGIVFGSVTLTRLGDIYGRKPVFLIGMILQIFVTAAYLISDSLTFAYILTFLIGLACTGKQFVGYSYLIEMQQSKHQIVVGSLEFIYEALIYLFVILYFSFLSKNWKYIQIPTIGFGVIGTMYLFFQPESPRFLICSKKYDEARKVFNLIAIKNGKSKDTALDFIFVEEQLQEKIIQSDDSTYIKEVNENQSEQSIKQLCTNNILRSNLVFSSFIWCSIMFNYYILAFYIKYFPGNVYENTLALVFSDLVAYIISGSALKRISMKKTLVLAQLFSLLGSLLYLFLYQELYLVPIIIVLCRFGNSMSFNTLYVGNNRLFPTQFLATTFGLVNFVSHMLAVGAPLVAEINDPYPFFVFLGNAGVALISCFFLIEVNRDKINQPSK